MLGVSFWLPIQSVNSYNSTQIPETGGIPGLTAISNTVKNISDGLLPQSGRDCQYGNVTEGMT